MADADRKRKRVSTPKVPPFDSFVGPSAVSTWQDEAAAVLTTARRRRRARCQHHTCYDHTNLAQWLAGELPDGWTVVPPPSLAHPDGTVVAAPSGFPEENNLEAQIALIEFLSMVGLTPDLDASDLIDGHCETVAAVTAEYFLKEIASGIDRAPADTALAAYSRLAADIAAADVSGQIGLLFGPQKRAEDTHSPRSHMWAALYPPAMAWPCDSTDFLAEMCAGVSPRFGPWLATALSLAEAPFAFPLYVTNYIWDGDELTEAELTKRIETACYSVHAIGLIVDPGRKLAYFADPNGPLLKGGSMEFVSLPFTRFGRGIKPTTAVSQWDRDEAALAAKP